MRRVLLVEDDASNADILRLFCERAGYAVIHATSGEAALEVLASEQVHVVLLDVLLPGIDGVAVFQAIRAHPRTRGLPVIFQTAAAERPRRFALLALQPDALLIKPFRRLDLLGAIEQALSPSPSWVCTFLRA